MIKFNIKTLAATIVVGSVSLFSTSALANDCGDITIAEMNWASAGVLAHIDRIILNSGYGCNAELVPGDTTPTFTSMDTKGQPDIAPEVWSHSLKDKLDIAVAEGRIILGSNSFIDGAQEGWWIPDYIANAHNIKTVADAVARPDLFPGAEDASKGAFFNCPAGWQCQIMTTNLFRAYDMENKGFELVDPGSGAGLDGSIAKAFERKEGWFGYYWSPTAMLGKYNMVKLDPGVPLNEKEYNTCTSQADCPNPKPNAWMKPTVQTLLSAKFASEASVAMDYVKTRSWSSGTASKVMAWVTDSNATNEDGAYYFLENYADVWEKWVPADVAAKVKAAL